MNGRRVVGGEQERGWSEKGKKNKTGRNGEHKIDWRQERKEKREEAKK